MSLPTKEKPAGVNELISFDISEPDMEVFNSFSDKMKAKITSAPEWNGKAAVHEVFEPDQIQEVNDEPINLDDIPFN
jgi:hypothetical protein